MVRIIRGSGHLRNVGPVFMAEGGMGCLHGGLDARTDCGTAGTIRW